MEDEELLALAEKTLTEIKVADGLSNRHASVLAALRIRLKGSAGGSLEEMLDAADDGVPLTFQEAEAETQSKRKQKPGLDDLLSQDPKPRREWPT